MSNTTEARCAEVADRLPSAPSIYTKPCLACLKRCKWRKVSSKSSRYWWQLGHAQVSPSRIRCDQILTLLLCSYSPEMAGAGRAVQSHPGSTARRSKEQLLGLTSKASASEVHRHRAAGSLAG